MAVFRSLAARSDRFDERRSLDLWSRLQRAPRRGARSLASSRSCASTCRPRSSSRGLARVARALGLPEADRGSEFFDAELVHNEATAAGRAAIVPRALGEARGQGPRRVSSPRYDLPFPGRTRTLAAPLPHPGGTRFLGMLLCYNDADVLGPVIDHLVRNRHDVVVWNHGSEDDTESVARARLGRGVIEYQDVDRAEVPFRDLYGVASRYLTSAYGGRYDWLSWPDQDEILEGPELARPYHEQVTELLAAGFDWVEFENFVFWFTDEDDPASPTPSRASAGTTSRPPPRRACAPGGSRSRTSAGSATRTRSRAASRPPTGRCGTTRCAALEQARRRAHHDRNQEGFQFGDKNWHYERFREDERALARPFGEAPPSSTDARSRARSRGSSTSGPSDSRSEQRPRRGAAMIPAPDQRCATPTSSPTLAPARSTTSTSRRRTPTARSRSSCDVLGFRRDPSLSSFLWLGNMQLAVTRGEPVRNPRFHIGFRLDSREHVDALRARLALRGITTSEPFANGSYYSCGFRDPAGYQIEIFADGGIPALGSLPE